MDGEDDYKFLKIRDAVTSINQKVNLIGVILEFGFPTRTKGTDFFCRIKIFDPTSPKHGISAHVFAESMESLPRIASAGDIIQLCHVMIKIHDQKVYAIFNKRFSSFALYEGKDGENFLPYQNSSRFQPSRQDKKFIAALRKWLVHFKPDIGSTNFLLLREIKEGNYSNLVCKVVYIGEISKDEWMVFLWDGTDCSSVSIHKKLEDEMDNHLPLHLEPITLSRDVLCTFPTVGTVLRVIIDPRCHKHTFRILEIGKWVKLLNVLCEVHAGLMRGVLTPSTKLQYLQNDDNLIQDRLSIYGERLLLNLGRISQWSFPWPSLLTVVDYDTVPFVTLMDVLTYSEVTSKFKCVVRFVAAFPWQIEDLRAPSGSYRVRFTLEDPTARIHAFVYAEDGEKFFDGYPPVDILRKRLNKLLGVTLSDDGKEVRDTGRNPPWVPCCLKSYYLDKSNKWGSRQYRIFGTKLGDTL